MNKSKFLKKSLAMVLAIMMVVAMIPLGASAAEPAPAIGFITVAGADAEGSGTEYTATVSSADASNFTIGVILAGGKGLVYDMDGNEIKDENDSSSGEKDGVFTFARVSLANLTDGKFQFMIYDDNGEQGKLITVKITQTAADNDATLKTFQIASQYGPTVIDNALNTITITVPYGYGTVIPEEVPTVEASSKKANPDWGSKTLAASGSQNITVTAESGAKKYYDIKVVAAEGFTSYSEANQAKDAVIDADNKNIEVVMPYGTEVDDEKSVATGGGDVYAFVPTFKTGYPSVKVMYDDPTTSAATKVEIKSGETTVYVADSASSETNTLNVDLVYTSGATETWTIDYMVPAKDPVAAISSLSVDSYRAEIEGTTITLEVPSTLRVAGAGSKNVDFTASESTKIEVLGTGLNGTANSNGDAQIAMDLSKDSYKLRVTSAGPVTIGGSDNEVKEYVLNIVTAEPEQAAVKTMYLTDKTGETEVEAVINNSANTITFTVPFAVKNQTDLTDWKLFYTVTSGSSIGYGSSLTPMPVSGKSFGTVSSTTQISYFPVDFDNPNAAANSGRNSITVETPGYSKKVYTVKVQRGTAATEHALQSFSVSSVNVFKNVTESNTFKGTISTSSVNVEVPYTVFNTAIKTTAYSQFTVSDKAKLYYIDSLGKFVEITGIEEDQTGTVTTLPTINGNYDGVATNPADGSLLTQKLVVVSEKGADKIVSGSTPFDPYYRATNAGQYTEYNLIVKSKPASSTTKLNSFSLYNATLDTTVEGDFSGDTITFNVPYNFTTSYRSATDSTGLGASLEVVYEVYDGETETDGLISRVVDSEGNVTTHGTTVTIDPSATNAAVGVLKNGVTPVTKINLRSEDTKQTGFYNVVVNILPAETGAVLNSVTINNVTAKPDAKNNIKVTLPYGSEVTALKVAFNASKNAVVTYGSSIVDPDTTYNFTSSKKFTVESENGQNTTTYTITVDTADQFTDVDTDDWFYSDVMTAAANGWITGTGNGNFSPASGMKRGDFALMITRVLNADLSAFEGETAFPDIPADKYYAAAVAYCVDKGYLSGYEDGKFYGERTIDRNAMAKVICEVKGLEQVTSTANPFADDAKIPTWAKGYVYACAEAGIILGDNNNNFNGSKTAKRCEAAAVLVRAFA